MNNSAPALATFIWDLPTLWGFLDHPSDSVQEWAASHLLELYPEATEQALEMLPQVSAAVAFHLLESLQSLELPETGVEPLQQLLRSEAAPHHRTAAAGLLFRLGRIPSEEDLAELPVEMLLGNLPETEAAVEIVFQEYLKDQSSGDSIIQAMAKACNVEDLFHALDQASQKEFRKAVGYLEKAWQVKLPVIHRVKDRSSAQRLMQEALDATTEPDSFARSRFPLLTDQLQQDRKHIRTLLKVTEECEAKEPGPPSPGAPSSESCLLLACVLGLYRDAACLNALSENSGFMESWGCLALRPWRSQKVEPELAASLQGQDPQEVLSGLRKVLCSGWGYCAHPFYMLDALRVPGRHQVLQEALDGHYGERVVEEAGEAEQLMLKDPEAMEALLGRWRQSPPEPHWLHLLAEHPTEGVVQFLLEHFDEYMSQPFSTYLVDTIGEVASPHFLEPLAEEWREGEEAIRRTIWFLAELHGMEGDDTIQHIPRETEGGYQLSEALEDPDKLAEMLQKPIAIPLRCTACKRTYKYHLERVYLGKRAKDVTIGQIVQCKGCGSLETYEITDETLSSLVVEMMRLGMMAGLLGEDEPPDSPLIGQPVAITAAGKTFRSLSEAYHFLVKEVEREPDNAELHRRLGNVLRNGLQPDLAMPHYQEALCLDPKEMDSVYSIADILVEQERYQEAAPYVETLVTLCRDPQLDEGLGRDIFGPLLELVAEIEVNTGYRIELLSPSEEYLDIKREAKEPVALELLPLDPGKPGDFEQMYHLFRHGSLPKGRPEQRWEEPEFDSRRPAYTEPIRVSKVGRNDTCPCGSGKKYKRCCGR